MSVVRVLDERSDPSLRRVLGRALARSRAADFAVTRVRLAGIDLSAGEFARMHRCRVLVGQVDADTLADPLASAHRDATRLARLRTLDDIIRSGRLRVRAAGIESWSPDFSVLYTPTGAASAADTRADTGGRAVADSSPGESSGVAFFGAHYFARPSTPAGPAWTCMVSDRAVVERARDRFEHLWTRGYDVLPVIDEAIGRLVAGRGEASGRVDSGRKHDARGGDVRPGGVRETGGRGGGGRLSGGREAGGS